METQLVAFAHEHPPRCIAGARPAPLRQPLPGVDAYPFMAYFTVGCLCGERATYPLGYHAKSEGSRLTAIFISPLAIECPVCERVSEILDTREHGFEGEQGCDCNMLGEGPRSRFPCPTCGVVPMVVIPGFSYQGDDFDPEAWGGRPQDYFGAYWLYGQCSQCGGVVEIAGFECA
jgi:hypothetical protein